MRSTIRSFFIALAALVAAAGAASADQVVTQSEPIAAQRTVTLKLITPTGATASGVSGTTIMVAQPGGNFVSANAADVTEVTGGGESLYVFQLAASEVANVGQVKWTVAKTGTIQVASGYVDVVAPRALLYGQAQGGAATSVTLPVSASSTDSFYAGNGASSIARIVAGTGAGQARLGTAYTGFTRQLTIGPAWTTNPDSTSIIEVLPYTGGLDPAVITSIQSGLATASAVAAIPTNPLLTSDTRLNHLDADISSRASSTAVAAIPTNPLLTSDSRLNDLDTTISSRSSQSSVNAIPTNPELASDSKLSNLDAAVSTRASQSSVNSISTNVAAIPTTPLLSTDTRLNNLDATVSSRATDAHVLAIPTNPELATDSKLSNLDAAVSTRATASAVAAIPTNPELASDSKLSNLDAAVSSRLAPATPGRTLAVTSTGQAGIDWGNVANPTTTQNLSGTTVAGGGGGGGGSPSAIAAAVWAYVPDSAVTNTAVQTMQQQWNVLFSVDTGNAVGLDGNVGSTSSLDLTKHRAEFTVQAGVRTFTSYNGN